mmetsp:Transcript_27267/g.73743  ORF Transcript_27267/g.73743 Transcript_27267/m.73743 type:complete len:343 (+) Transcript_27267:434-1462(+)
MTMVASTGTSRRPSARWVVARPEGAVVFERRLKHGRIDGQAHGEFIIHGILRPRRTISRGVCRRTGLNERAPIVHHGVLELHLVSCEEVEPAVPIRVGAKHVRNLRPVARPIVVTLRCHAHQHRLVHFGWSVGEVVVVHSGPSVKQEGCPRGLWTRDRTVAIVLAIRLDKLGGGSSGVGTLTIFERVLRDDRVCVVAPVRGHGGGIRRVCLRDRCDVLVVRSDTILRVASNHELVNVELPSHIVVDWRFCQHVSINPRARRFGGEPRHVPVAWVGGPVVGGPLERGRRNVARLGDAAHTNGFQHLRRHIEAPFGHTRAPRPRAGGRFGDAALEEPFGKWRDR